MKKFLFRIIRFSLPLIMIFYLKPVYLLINNRYQNIVAGDEIYLSINKTRQKNHQKKVLIGDSAGYMLFPNKINDSAVISLTCNQAISLAGQYILLQNYLNSGNDIDTLFMIFGPEGFLNNLDQIYTFHYFLKPFYKDEYKQYFSDLVYQQINKIPFVFLCREPYILTSNWAPKFKSQDSVNFTFLSPISVEYLTKIKDLGTKKGFPIVLLPGPVSNKKKQIIDTFEKNEAIPTGMQKEFEYFWANLVYLEDSLFVDGVHLKNPCSFTEYYRSRWIK